jgi:hypothetical protein
MNGRIYDPLLGRFLSADPNIDGSLSLQGYNRYSYVKNNPLTFTDPTGFYSFLGLEFTDGGGASGFVTDTLSYGGSAFMGAVGDNAVAGYNAGEGHLETSFTELSNAHSAGDVGISAVAAVASFGDAVGTVLAFTPEGKAEGAAVSGAEKLATKAEAVVESAVTKTEGAAGTAEARLEGVTTGAESTIKTNTAPTTEFNGGLHGETKGPVGDGLESYHMPPDSVSPVSRDKGSAIQMDPADHAATSSHGSQGAAGAEYRKQIGDMVNSGDPKQVRNAYATEVRDVRRAAGEVSGDATKYNQATQKMLDKAKDQKLLPPNN